MMTRGIVSILLFVLPLAARAADLKPVPEEPFTGPVHAQNAGKVVFSKSKIGRAPADPAAFASTFTLSDPLYVRPFLASSGGNLLRAQGVECVYSAWAPSTSVEARVNGGEWAWIDSQGVTDKGFDEWRTWSLDANPETNLTAGPTTLGKDDQKPPFRFGGVVVPQLKTGDNKVEFQAVVLCAGKDPAKETKSKHEGKRGAAPLPAQFSTTSFRAVAATGAITLEVKEGDVARWLAANGPRLPASPNGDDAALKPLILEAVAKSWRNESVLDAVLSTKDWFVKRHPVSGIALERKTLAYVVTRLDAKTTCRALEIEVHQESTDGTLDHWASKVTFEAPVPATLNGGIPVEFPCPAPAPANDRK